MIMLYEDVEGIVANAQLRSLMDDGCRAVSEYLRENRSFTVDIDVLCEYLRGCAADNPKVADILCTRSAICSSRLSSPPRFR